jgi:adenylosuccinate lyase
LNVNQEAIKRNLETYAPFAMTERIMMLAGKKGADRQEIHELLRQHALIAWQAVHQGQPNPLIQNLQKEPVLQKWISPEEIQQLSELDTYVGFAKERTKSLVEEIRSRIQ